MSPDYPVMTYFATLTLAPAVDECVTLKEPLALGGVHTRESSVCTPGGKGVNVAKMLRMCGARVRACGLVGGDRHGAFDGFLSGIGVESRFMEVDHPTRRNFMFSDGRGGEFKVNEPAFPGLEFDWDLLEEYIIGAFDGIGVAVLSGSLPARFPPDTYAKIIGVLAGRGICCAIDCSGEALRKGLAARPGIIKPNRREFEYAAGSGFASDRDIARCLAGLAGVHEVAIMSDGGNGAYFSAGPDVFHATAPAVRKVDTTGAGDMLLGAFLAGYFADGAGLTPDVMRQAVAAGSAAVELKGAPAPDMSRVRELEQAVEISRLSMSGS